MLKTVGDIDLYDQRVLGSVSRSDVLGLTTMLDRKGCALRLDELVGLCSETGETVTLGDPLAGGA